ncbi:hypothetical protein ACFLV7_07905 [Chloroflexota bacterium]
MSLKVLFILVLIFLIVACNSYNFPADIKRTQILPTQALLPTPMVISPSPGVDIPVTISFERIGGFAGYNDRLVLYPDGKVVIARKNGECRQNISQAARQNLVSQLKKNRSTEPTQDFLPENTCCDLIEYTLKYDGITIRTMDTATPQFLKPVLNILNKIVDECE